MFRRFALNRLLFHTIQSDTLNYFKNVSRDKRTCRYFSVTVTCYKKRKTKEEKAMENSTGRQVIRFSPKAGQGVIGIWQDMTVKDLARVLMKDVDKMLEVLEYADQMSNIQYDENTVIKDQKVLWKAVRICGYRYKSIAKPGEPIKEEQNKDAFPSPPPPPEALRPRPPVVCVMGHVDHGKTTLLDSLRNSAVVDSEFGGITQHIGAFEVRLQSGGTVTFLDTPGHAAFTSMRARGARSTDIVVLVVAADDGVMEQTVESIRMAREAKVPILVAINKMDKPAVNIDRTMRSLAQHGVVCEALGGDVQAIPISALKKMNLDTLVEALNLQAQLLELKADPNGPVEGVVLETLVHPKIGKQATVLVQQGTLKKGCIVVAGLGWAKVRALSSSEGRPVQAALPSVPVSVLGWRELPAPGDLVLEVTSEKRAGEVMKWRQAERMKEKQAADLEVIKEKEREHNLQYRAQLERKRSLGRRKMRAEGPRVKAAEDTHPTLSVVVKGDVDGSVEAIMDIMDTYDEDHRVRLDLVHIGVGQITPSDIEIAETFNAIVYAFNIDCPQQLADEAKAKNVAIRHHNVIYKLVDDMKEELTARIPVRQEEEVLGEANVLQQFLVSDGRKKVPVAGCRCVKGSLSKQALYRVLRDGQVVHEGKLASMKHLKDEVESIKKDVECGLRFTDKTFEMKPGDTIICYKMVDVYDKTTWDPGF